MSVDDQLDEVDQLYSTRVGERLRSIRRQKRLSLHDVEDRSHAEFKASVLGAYERGERSISVPRLQRLARHYDVPVEQLLPNVEADDPEDLSDRVLQRRVDSVVLDLQSLAEVQTEEVVMLGRYVRTIQVQRQDFNGRMLTLRRDDIRAMACILGVPTDRAIGRLDELGLCRQADV